MNKYLWGILVVGLFAACAENRQDMAASMLSKINSLYQQGKYCEALDSISALRTKFPKDIKARTEALKLWQAASLKMAQNDVARTDSLLQATLKAIPREPDLYRANMMRVRRDSLKARYEAMCGVVRMIRYRQRQN